jgi:hypothetical protein
MSPARPQRTQSCGRREAQTRLQDARAQLDLAGLATAASTAAEQKAAVSSAVLAGIAASDAACCSALGERSRSADHRDAVALVRDIAPGGAEAAKQLRRLLDLKDASQYGFEDIGGRRMVAAVRHAEALVAFAERAVRA